MGTGPFTASHIIKAAFPAVKGSILQPQTGRRTQDCQICRNRVQGFFRDGSAVHSIHKFPRFRQKAGPVFQTISSACPGILKKYRIIIFPGCPVAYIIMDIGGADIQAAPVIAAVRYIPGEYIMEFLLFPRRDNLAGTKDTRILIICDPCLIMPVRQGLT